MNLREFNRLPLEARRKIAASIISLNASIEDYLEKERKELASKQTNSPSGQIKESDT